MVVLSERASPASYLNRSLVTVSRVNRVMGAVTGKVILGRQVSHHGDATYLNRSLAITSY
jgi:hypothetical protein